MTVGGRARDVTGGGGALCVFVWPALMRTMDRGCAEASCPVLTRRPYRNVLYASPKIQKRSGHIGRNVPGAGVRVVARLRHEGECE